MRVDGDLNESFTIGVKVRRGFVILPWLFDIVMDACVREMKAKVKNVGVRLNTNGMS